MMDKGKMEKELGKIESAWIGIDDHGWLACRVGLNFGAGSQAFAHVLPREKAGIIIKRILEAVGVQNWDDLVGQEMYVYRPNPMSAIFGIEAPAYRKSAHTKPLFIDPRTGEME